MKKKFLDKQGLAEFCKSFKDKFASKSDLEPVSSFMSKMSFEEQKQYWIKQICSLQMNKKADMMLLSGCYLFGAHIFIDDSCQLHQGNNEDYLSLGCFNAIHNNAVNVTVETLKKDDHNVEQVAYNSSRSIVFSRKGRSVNTNISDEALINILNEANSLTPLTLDIKMEWSPWLVDFNYSLGELPFVSDGKNYFYQFGLLSREDKIKLDNITNDNTISVLDSLYYQDKQSALSANQGYVLYKTKVDKVDGKQLSSNDYTNEDKQKLIKMPKLVFLEKEQYANFNEKEKMDNTKLYYIYAERPQ